MPEPIDNTTPRITLVEEDCSYNCPVCHRGEALSQDEWYDAEEHEGEEFEAVRDLVFTDNYAAVRDAIGDAVAPSSSCLICEWPFDSSMPESFSHPFTSTYHRDYWARDEEVILENNDEPHTPLLTYDP